MARDPDVPAYFPALDGVRFFACAMVVVSHCFAASELRNAHPLIRHGLDEIGKTGVDVFFALSGFLITKLLLDEKRAHGRVDLLAFYARRTLRIWPVFYVALAIGFGAAALAGDRFCGAFGAACPARLFSVSLPANLAFVGNWVEHLALPPPPIATLWSVCIEEQFYLLFPVTFVFARRQAPVFRSVAIGFAIAWATRAWLAAHDREIFHHTFAHADNLLAGALLAQLVHAKPARVVAFFRRAPLAFELLGVIALAAFNEWEVERVHGVAEWLAFYAVSAAITGCLVGTFAFGGGPIARWLARPRLRFMGQLTYAAYAFHLYAVLLVWIALKRLPLDGAWMGVARVIVAVPLAMALAWLSRVTFELRFLRLKDRFTRAPAADASAA